MLLGVGSREPDCSVRESVGEKYQKSPTDRRFSWDRDPGNYLQPPDSARNILVPAEGFEPLTNGLQSTDRVFQWLMNQPLAALASPAPRPTKARLRHTQVELGTLLAQSESPQSQRRSTAMTWRTPPLMPSRAGAWPARSGAAPSILAFLLRLRIREPARDSRRFRPRRAAPVHSARRANVA